MQNFFFKYSLFNFVLNILFEWIFILQLVFGLDVFKIDHTCYNSSNQVLLRKHFFGTVMHLLRSASYWEAPKRYDLILFKEKSKPQSTFRLVLAKPMQDRHEMSHDAQYLSLFETCINSLAYHITHLNLFWRNSAQKHLEKYQHNIQNSKTDFKTSKPSTSSQTKVKKIPHLLNF